MTTVRVIDPVAALLEAQVGVARVDQLLRLGVARADIRQRIRSRSWLQMGSSVIVATAGSLTADQREWAAVAGAGRYAALCGLSAAAHYGLKGFEDERIHVVVPRGIRPRRTPLPVAIHESRRFDPFRDVEPARLLPMTRLERSVLDAATWSPSARAACAIMVCAVQQRLTTGTAMLDQLEQLGLVRHHDLMRTVLRDIAGGDALSTIDMPRLCRQHGLPRPRHVTIRPDADGRRRFLEVEFTSKRGKSWLVEVDAAAQLIVGNYWSDSEPPEHLIVSGESVLYVPAIDLYLNEVAVVTQLHRILDD